MATTLHISNTQLLQTFKNRECPAKYDNSLMWQQRKTSTMHLSVIYDKDVSHNRFLTSQPPSLSASL